MTMQLDVKDNLELYLAAIYPAVKLLTIRPVNEIEKPFGNGGEGL